MGGRSSTIDLRKPRGGQHKNHVYDYDVFLCCASSDDECLARQMLEKLEDLNYKVCFHDRDFTPGRPIVDNIQDALTRSRYALFLVTNNFFESEWCKFEFNLAFTPDFVGDQCHLFVINPDGSLFSSTLVLQSMILFRKRFKDNVFVNVNDFYRAIGSVSEYSDVQSSLEDNDVRELLISPNEPDQIDSCEEALTYTYSDVDGDIVINVPDVENVACQTPSVSIAVAYTLDKRSVALTIAEFISSNPNYKVDLVTNGKDNKAMIKSIEMIMDSNIVIMVASETLLSNPTSIALFGQCLAKVLNASDLVVWIMTDYKIQLPAVVSKILPKENIINFDSDIYFWSKMATIIQGPDYLKEKAKDMDKTRVELLQGSSNGGEMHQHNPNTELSGEEHGRADSIDEYQTIVDDVVDAYDDEGISIHSLLGTDTPRGFSEEEDDEEEWLKAQDVNVKLSLSCNVPLNRLGKLYDFYLSFALKDQVWVSDMLLSPLEKDHGFKGCVFGRDVSASPVRITEAVKESACMVVVLSDNYSMSYRCLKEVETALALHMDKRRDIIIPIRFGRCPIPDYIRRITFLQVTDSVDWPRLTRSLQLYMEE